MRALPARAHYGTPDQAWVSDKYDFEIRQLLLRQLSGAQKSQGLCGRQRHPHRPWLTSSFQLASPLAGAGWPFELRTSPICTAMYAASAWLRAFSFQ